MNIITKCFAFVLAVAFTANFSHAAEAEIPNDLPEASVVKLSAINLAGGTYIAHPNGDSTVERPLQVVMNFKSNETAEEVKNSKYCDYLCDFYLTFTGIKGGQLMAKDCYLAGHYGSFGWVVIPTDEVLIEEGVSYPVVSGYDATLNYKDICTSVKDFIAAIYIAPAILEANPDFKVKLELKLKDPITEICHTIGNSYTYDVNELRGIITMDVPDASKVLLDGAVPSYSSQNKIKELTIDFVGNSSLINVETGLGNAANAESIAAAQAKLEEAGVSKEDAAAAKPVVKIALSAVETDGNDEFGKFVFDVSPVVAVGGTSVKVESFAAPITFRLPVPAADTREIANIYHEDELLGLYSVKSEDGCKYVEVSSKVFSAFAVEMLDYSAKIGETKYVSLEAAIAAAGESAKVELVADVTLTEDLEIAADKKFTLDLGGFCLEAEEGIEIVNAGELTIKDSAGDFSGFFGVKLVNNNKVNIEGGVFAMPIASEASAEIKVSGGAFVYAIDAAWMPAGYVCSELKDDGEGMSIYVVAKLPTATTSTLSESELRAAPSLTYSLKFSADNVSMAQFLAFSEWYADFELTVSKDVTFNAAGESDGYLAGSYDSWQSGLWVSVPGKPVLVEADKPLRIMEFGETLMSTNGLKMTYGEIFDVVKTFRCGVKLSDAFVAANPGFKVTLALKVYNPHNESESYLIGSEYEFEIPSASDSVVVTDTNGKSVNCKTLNEAIDVVAESVEAANGGEIAIIKNTSIDEDVTVTGTRNLFFDLGENTLTLAEGKKFELSNINVAIVGSGALAGFAAESVVMDDRSVLTLPASAQALAEALETAGRYVTKNEDGSWSVANNFVVQIQMDGNEPKLGFLKDTRPNRDYVIEASYDLVDWAQVEYGSATGDSEVAVPLKWQKPQDGQFFRVRAVAK